MKNYIPPFKITGSIVQLSEAIAYELGRLAGEKMIAPKLSLRKSNQIKTIHASLAIEGNILTIDQVTDLLEGKRVLGSAREILEVKNAGELYNNLSLINPLENKDLLNAHAILMDQLITEPGRFRSGGVGIFNGAQVTHMPPSAKRVPMLMEDLFKYIQNTTEYSWLIKSCVFHYEFEFIHPFEDGNGRIGRLWQHLLLIKHHPVFEFLPVEVLIKKHQQEYYSTLSQSDREGESTAFIEFMLKIIYQTLQQYGKSAKYTSEDSASRLVYAMDLLKTDSFSRKQYMDIHRDISQATASRDLLYGVENTILLKSGSKNQTAYRYIKSKK